MLPIRFILTGRAFLLRGEIIGGHVAGTMTIFISQWLGLHVAISMPLFSAVRQVARMMATTSPLTTTIPEVEYSAGDLRAMKIGSSPAAHALAMSFIPAASEASRRGPRRHGFRLAA